MVREGVGPVRGRQSGGCEITTQDLINTLRQGAPVTARQVKAMEAQAELDALIEAARSVAAWHKGEGVIMRSELDALAALVGEG